VGLPQLSERSHKKGEETVISASQAHLAKTGNLVDSYNLLKRLH